MDLLKIVKEKPKTHQSFFDLTEKVHSLRKTGKLK